ncbi:protein translocase subunit SecD [Streptomyces marispadix]|uniref:Multifunctional fusion protein n=1 Tax=Streptomyces marispadix TaxID=2922868 RepID=A0ABS9SXR1_9ACTN|nr:protein translocase subunit SecD [Streptomyces marispadix]MCH6161003.1 protein translocase subunit SecD [Streptomyces marispadix]
MTRANRVRATIALAVMALAAFLAVTKQPRLGIDLRGGTQIVLESRDSARTEATPSTTDDTMEVLRQRVDALGVAEPSLVRSGDDRIIVELPGLQDPKQAAEVLGRTAQLTFHPVEGVPERAPETGRDDDHADKDQKNDDKPGDDKPGGARDGHDPQDTADIPRTDESGRPVKLGGTAMTGVEVESARAAVDPQRGSGWFVDLAFRDKGEREWADLTGKAACSPAGDPQRRVAIVLDDKVISSPQVDPSVSCRHGISGGSTQITGDFGEKEAKELATLIEGGALPVPVEVIEHHTVGPTLGADAIEASAWAAATGVLLTSGFVICVYRLFGALTAVGLLCYGLISYAALLAFGATLTLPGLAGFVLAIGMAVDANVLVFERAREEYEYAGRGRSLRTAAAKGFRGAFGAILDSNVTTLLAALLLFTLASGPVRGFGVTLSIGVLASMISALVVTRSLVDLTVARRFVRARPRLTGLAGLGRVRTRLTKRNPDWMRYGRRWLAVSGAAVVLAVCGIVLRGLDFGVEFTGGRLVEYSTSQPVDPEAARSALADAGLPDAVVQNSGGGSGTGGPGHGGGGEITVRAESLTGAQEETVRSTLADLGGGTEKVRDELFGPSLGDELRQNALIALGVALGAQLLYLACRFRWTFGASAVLALAHDAVILVGAFAWLGKPVDGVFLAALLTVIGYSVNDSVVIFDRVRSEWRGEGHTKAHGDARGGRRGRRKSFRDVVNTAVVQTVPRTLNTGMGALFIIAALTLLGGDSLGDFALALLVGIAVGSYSSLFVGAPLAVELEARTGTPPRTARGPAPQKRTKPSTRRSPNDNGARV